MFPDDSSSRKFIDLIWKASGKWANWDPPRKIEVGDYGEVDKDSGKFTKQGNIYEDDDIYADNNDIKEFVAKHRPERAVREEKIVVSSANGKDLNFSTHAEAEALGLAKASIKGQWSFGAKRGALLILAQPRSSYVPDEILSRLIKVAALQNMFLVTTVFSCSSYYLYLSNGRREAVDIALLGSAPLPHAPAITAGGGIGGHWWSQNAGGFVRHAHDALGNDGYAPLYMLKEIRKSHWDRLLRREDPATLERLANEPAERWVDIQPPWGPLDEDGNDDDYEDI